MRRDEAVRRLQKHEDEFRERGVLHMRIFGSVARDEATAESDVDVLADWDPDRRISLVTVGSLQVRLTEIMETEVDLSSTKWLKPRVYARAEKEWVLAF